MRATILFTTVALLSAALINAYDPVKMLCLVNKERSRSGLKPLGLSKKLENAAKEHSNDQARMRSMTHNGSDGSSPSDRVDRAGYNWRSVAENVAYGYGDEEECMQEWMNSPGHRQNILGRDYTHFGSAVGYAGSTPYYTQTFAGDGQSHNFPECPSGDAYGDSGGSDNMSDSGYGNEGAPDYSSGGSSPSSNYNDGGSSPSSNYNGGESSPSKYGKSSPSKHGKSSPSKYGKSSPSKNYSGGSSPSSNYGGRSPSNGNRRTHKSGRKVTSYGGNVSDSNDKKKKYGSNTTKDYGKKKTYGGKKPHRHGSRHARPSQGRKGSRNTKSTYGRKGNY